MAETRQNVSLAQRENITHAQHEISADDLSARDDTGLSCLVMLAHFLGVPAQSEQLRHQLALGKDHCSRNDLVRAARLLHLRARAVTIALDRLEQMPVPAIAVLHDGRYCVIGRVMETQLLVKLPDEAALQLVDHTDFHAIWSGDVVLLTRRAGLSSAACHFGLGWFLPAIARYRRFFAEALVASFALQLLGLASPILFQVVIDKVLVHRGISTLDVMITGLVLLGLFEAVLGGLRTYIFSHTTNRIDVELGAKLYEHLLALPLPYFAARRVGDSVARVRELEHIRSFITGSGLTVVVDVVFTFVFIAVMFAYSTQLTLIVLATLPLFVLLSVLVTPIFRGRLKEKFERGAENQSFLVESISGVETLKAMAVEPQMQRRWEEQLAAYVSASFRAQMVGNVATETVECISHMANAAILLFGAKAVIDGSLTVGELVAFNMLSGRVSEPVMRLAQLWQDFHQTRISIDRLGDILNSPREGGGDTPHAGTRATLPPIVGNVRLERVTFRYRPDGPAVLSNIDIDVPAGQTVGIVGPSGSGKSTLTKLIQRMYVPEQGRVMVDGVDLALADTTWLRRQVGVVLQENTLFNRTVRENIALTDPAMPMSRVIEAAKLAGAHDFILEMPHGYDAIIGERGNSLSGGQRQRIAIARALVPDPPILIFDEATSALDYESESVIQANMRAICAGRTVFIIAHRLSTVRHADRILTIDRGRLVEDGTHDRLLKGGGRYARLHALQAGGLVDAE